MGRKPMWIDCDPGHDDAMALILAGYSPHVELLGVSTVAGNQTCDKTTENAVRVLAAAGLKHIEVCKGQAKPLMRPRPMLCPEIHGDTGLQGHHGGHAIPDPAPEEQRSYPRAVPHMFERISARHAATGERVQLVAIGALTNVALLLVLYPEVCNMIDITIMGGAMGIGNTGPVQEFNIQTDPEAAAVVFEAGVPLVMVPLEVTHVALATPGVLARLCPAETPPPPAFLRMIRDLLLFFAKTYKEVFGFDSPPLHDPTAVAYVIDPSLFQTELMRVDIETRSEVAAGQTVCDVWHQSAKPKNCVVAKAMDAPKFWGLMCAAVEAANEKSPMNAAGGGILPLDEL